MARKSSGGSQPGLASTVTSALLICVAVAIALLGHIRFKDDLNRLGRSIAGLELALKEQRRSNDKLQSDYETLVSPLGLEARLREMRLNLVVPGDGARVVLREPVPGTDRPGSEHPTTARTDRSLALGGGGAETRSDSGRQPVARPWN